MLYLFSFIDFYIVATACRLTALGKQSPKLSLLIDRKVKLSIGALKIAYLGVASLGAFL